MDENTNNHHTASLIAIPILLRLGLFLAVPLFEYSFHKLTHLGIHLSIHKVEWLKKMEKRFKYLPDLLMIAALVILHFVTE